MMHAHANANVSTVSGKRYAFMSDRPFRFQQTTAAGRMLVHLDGLTREPQRARVLGDGAHELIASAARQVHFNLKRHAD
jgi:hypothetical protein